jgi:tetratricopeptide (TPR) repeat protein
MMCVMLDRSASMLPALLCLGCSSVSPRPEDLAGRELRTASTAADREAAVAAAARSRSLLANRRYDEAADVARAGLERDPADARLHAALGLALVQLAVAEEPADLHRQNEGDGESMTAVRLAPGDPVVGLLRGQVLAAVGHLSAAAGAAEACLAHNAPRSDADYVALLAAAGEWRYELGEEHLAIPHLTALTQYRPDDSTLQFHIGSCLLRTAVEPATAVAAGQAFRRCAELAPGDDDAHLAIVAAHVRAAELWRSAERGDEAAKALDAAAAVAAATAARFAALAEPNFQLGVVAEMRGDSGEARQAYARALERDPDHLGALLNSAGQAAADPAGTEVARGLWRRALEVDARRGGLSSAERRRLRELLDDAPPGQAPRML